MTGACILCKHQPNIAKKNGPLKSHMVELSNINKNESCECATMCDLESSWCWALFFAWNIRLLDRGPIVPYCIEHFLSHWQTISVFFLLLRGRGIIVCLGFYLILAGWMLFLLQVSLVNVCIICTHRSYFFHFRLTWGNKRFHIFWIDASRQ